MKSKTKHKHHSPKSRLVSFGSSTDYMLTHTSFIYLDSYLTSLFFFSVFWSILSICNLAMINCIHLTCTIWWVLTDVHTCEIAHSGYRTFPSSSKDSLCPYCRPSLLRPWWQAASVYMVFSLLGSHKYCHTVCGLLCLVLHFAWCFWDLLCCIYVSFLVLLFRCMSTLYIRCSFMCWWTFMLFTEFGYCE